MITTNKRLAALAFGFAVAASASQSFARTDHGQQARDKVILDCNQRSYPNSTLEVARYTRYTVCKSRHGQQPN